MKRSFSTLFTITMTVVLASVLSSSPSHADGRSTAAAIVPQLPAQLAVVPAAQMHERVESPGFAVDVEIDPIAYALDGHSLHVGFLWERFRLDLGAFALELPEALHGNDDFTVAFSGFGTKLDAFWRRDRKGPFVGIEASLSEVRVIDDISGVLDRARRFQASVRAGWRIGLPAEFYATPWIGIGYAFGAEDRIVAGRAFEESPLIIFPTVHIGRTFD